MSIRFVMVVCLSAWAAAAQAAESGGAEAAYAQGDFEAARALSLPLAEAGDAGAQYRVADRKRVV